MIKGVFPGETSKGLGGRQVREGEEAKAAWDFRQSLASAFTGTLECKLQLSSEDTPTLDKEAALYTFLSAGTG